MSTELYSDFYNETSEAITTLENLSDIQFSAESEHYIILFRIAHTLKGNSMFLEEEEHCALPALIDLIHAFESYLEFMSAHMPQNNIDSLAITMFIDVVADFCDNTIQSIPPSYQKTFEYIQTLLYTNGETQNCSHNHSPIVQDSIWKIIDLINTSANGEFILQEFFTLCSNEHINHKLQNVLSLIHQHLTNVIESHPPQCSQCIFKKFDNSLCHLSNIIRSQSEKNDYINYLKRCLNLIEHCQSCTHEAP